MHVIASYKDYEGAWHIKVYTHWINSSYIPTMYLITARQVETGVIIITCSVYVVVFSEVSRHHARTHSSKPCSTILHAGLLRITTDSGYSRYRKPLHDLYSWTLRYSTQLYVYFLLHYLTRDLNRRLVGHRAAGQGVCTHWATIFSNMANRLIVPNAEKSQTSCDLNPRQHVD